MRKSVFYKSTPYEERWVCLLPSKDLFWSSPDYEHVFQTCTPNT